ncbi:MAG: ATP-binding protein [Chloroflexota bacterium]
MPPPSSRHRYRGGWGPRADWAGGSARPPWWPEGEAWPPVGWRRRRPGFGCLFGLLFVLVVVTLLASLVVVVAGALEQPVAAGLLISVVVVALVLVGRRLGALGATLDALGDAASRLESGDYTVRVDRPERGPGSLRQLVAGFNTMASRLEANERQRRTFLAEVAHELRTPLAVIQGNVEAIIDGIHPPDEANLGLILDETQVLSRLVDDLRTLALSEAGSLELHREPTDVDVLVGDVAAAFGTAAATAGLTLAIDVPDDLPILEVDPVRTREVLSNLVANALRYTPRGGTITVRGRASRDGGVRIEVADTGPGIPADLLPHVFERFTKSPESRGSGLGLALARRLVEAHGGEIGVDSSPGNGTAVWFRLPPEGPVDA